MTIEQLLECDAATLKAMSDEQLLAHFEPMFKVTRPELQVRVTKQTTAEELGTLEERNAIKLKIQKLKAMGIDVGDEAAFIRRHLKKK